MTETSKLYHGGLERRLFAELERDDIFFNQAQPRVPFRKNGCERHGTNKGVFVVIDYAVPESNQFLRGLDRNERYVLALFYADQLTVPEISLVLDLAEHRVRGILEQLRDRARAMLGMRAATA